MTDRTLTSSSDLDALDFSKGDGLLPVVSQNAGTGEVLMVAWASREALERTLASGQMWFFSRSRATLWRKGETSGNTLALVSLRADCDGDTVLAQVEPTGPACHTGEATCFGESVVPPAGGRSASAPPDTVMADLDATLAARAAERPEGSYTARLLDDENLRLKKLGEETAELIVALATRDGERAAQEAADLFYHVLVALRGSGVELASVMNALEDRRR